MRKQMIDNIFQLLEFKIGFFSFLHKLIIALRLCLWDDEWSVKHHQYLFAIFIEVIWLSKHYCNFSPDQ